MYSKVYNCIKNDSPQFFSFGLPTGSHLGESRYELYVDSVLVLNSPRAGKTLLESHELPAARPAILLPPSLKKLLTSKDASVAFLRRNYIFFGEVSSTIFYFRRRGSTKRKRIFVREVHPIPFISNQWFSSKSLR
jgi:hypothetical protein